MKYYSDDIIEQKYQEYLDEYDDIINEDADYGDKFESHLINLYTHLLKYYYQPERQSRSWIETIKNSINEINRIINDKKGSNKNKIRKLEDIQYNIYEKAKKQASKETGKPSTSFPNLIPDDFMIENGILDLEKVLNKMSLMANTTEAKKYFNNMK